MKTPVSASSPMSAIIPTQTAIDVLKRAIHSVQIAPTAANGSKLGRFLSTSDANYGKHKDTVIDDLYVRQARATDTEERKRILRTLEKRLLDDEAHVVYTLQWHRIIPHNSRVKGWTITPSHYLNNQLDTVWLGE